MINPYDGYLCTLCGASYYPQSNKEDLGLCLSCLYRDPGDEGIYDMCQECNGSGEGMYDGSRCRGCGGTGEAMYYGSEE